MVLMALFTTFITTPIVMTIYKPARMSGSEYKYRTIQTKESNSRLRLLICFHSSRNIPSLLNLMEASRGTQYKAGLQVYAMHLMELSERSSAILMVHKARRNGMPFWNGFNNPSGANQVVVAFETFQQLSQVSVRPTTAISSIASMHEDICDSAARKKAAIVILPFHKHQTIDGSLETTRNDLRYVNKRVLEHAPCSVGIFIDRGLGGTSQVAASLVDYTVTTFFFGGCDDREALSYGTVMAEHPGIRLNVVHFVVDTAITGDSIQLEVGDQYSSEARSSDGAFLEEFKLKAAQDSSITIKEIAVSNVTEAIDIIRQCNRSNLFIIGRIPEGEVAAALNKKGECPELGPVGNLLISREFSTASVLVVQQYCGQLSGDSLESLKAEDESDSR